MPSQDITPHVNEFIAKLSENLNLNSVLGLDLSNGASVCDQLLETKQRLEQQQRLARSLLNLTQQAAQPNSTH
jgi:hypothetical protein